MGPVTTAMERSLATFAGQLGSPGDRGGGSLLPAARRENLTALLAARQARAG